MAEARVWVSLSDGVLEFEGSESFVTSQVEKFTKIIQAARGSKQPAMAITGKGECSVKDKRGRAYRALLTEEFVRVPGYHARLRDSEASTFRRGLPRFDGSGPTRFRIRPVWS